VVNLAQILLFLLWKKVVRFLEIELHKIVREVPNEAIHRVREYLTTDALRVEALYLRNALREIDDNDLPLAKLSEDFLGERFVYLVGVKVNYRAQFEIPPRIGRAARLSLSSQEFQDRLQILVGPLPPLVAPILCEEVVPLVLVPDDLEPVSRVLK